MANEGCWLDPQTATQWHPYNGMSLRDVFAAAALTGQLSTEQGFAADSDKLAKWSYQLADALLTARERKEDA